MTSILGPRDRAVYKWQREVILPHDSRPVSVDTARHIVNYVWDEEGLRAPPQVVGKRMGGAYANRLAVTMSDQGVPSYVILHELAHSMDVSVEVSAGFCSDRPDGESLTGSTHDANWLGIYLNLLDKYIGRSLNKLYLMGTLEKRGLDYSLVPVIRCK